LLEPLPKLEDYVSSFVEWMGTEKFIHSQESELHRANSLLNDHYHEIRRRAKEKWNSMPPELQQFSSREQILTDFTRDGLAHLQDLPLNEGVLSDAEFNEVIEDEAMNINEKINYIFEDLGLNAINLQMLRDSASLVLSRAQHFPGSSTLAFVGYGRVNYFPSNMRLFLRGFYGGKFIFEKGELSSIHPEGGSGISAFAQDEAIFGFVRGARWEIVNYVADLVAEKVNAAVASEDGENLGKAIADEVFDAINDFNRRRFTDPLLNSIEGLDIGHLANLAESLVGMEATSAFGGDGPATVGGLIEVATIDRQLGVQWLKTL